MVPVVARNKAVLVLVLGIEAVAPDNSEVEAEEVGRRNSAVDHNHNWEAAADSGNYQVAEEEEPARNLAEEEAELDLLFWYPQQN